MNHADEVNVNTEQETSKDCDKLMDVNVRGMKLATKVQSSLANVMTELFD